MPPIQTSIFELFRIGPGPSSSHTIGPMRAAARFLDHANRLDSGQLAEATGLSVQLFGSLSATGRGHGTAEAVTAGLLGYLPENAPADILDQLRFSQSTHRIRLGKRELEFSPKDIIFEQSDQPLPWPNTLRCVLSGPGGVLLTREYYSIGGGFVLEKGETAELNRPQPPYPYQNMAECKAQLTTHELRLHHLMLENEKALTGASEEQIYAGLEQILDSMEQSVQRGLQTTGLLPGSLELQRKAPALYYRLQTVDYEQEKIFLALNAYAFAAAEENAAGHSIVTAPTAGASGILPAVVVLLAHTLGLGRRQLCQGLLAAATVGFLAKHNASIAGAEVGCQGEVGVASAMAAALISYAKGHRFRVTENAAETALEHHLGLTCDPVGGYVQIPCIERNAMGAIKAYNAFLIATAVAPTLYKVDLDKVIQAMAATGRDLLPKYRETAAGGLALCLGQC
ncbi:MAG: L-serine ammonia-lyase [Thermodesulfobacteriota bacterium]